MFFIVLMMNQLLKNQNYQNLLKVPPRKRRNIIPVTFFPPQSKTRLLQRLRTPNPHLQLPSLAILPKLSTLVPKVVLAALQKEESQLLLPRKLPRKDHFRKSRPLTTPNLYQMHPKSRLMSHRNRTCFRRVTPLPINQPS